MYEVIFDEKAIEFLEKLPKNTSTRIFNKIMQAKTNPLHYFERLTGRKDHKLRVGDYRVIADIESAERIIKITLIGHRKNVYENLPQA